MGKIRMGYWDCRYCDKAKIPGSDRECPGCGRPRPEGTKFYLDGSEPARYLGKAEEDVIRSRGKDWACVYCGSLNSGLDETCPGCGASRHSNNKSSSEAAAHGFAARDNNNYSVPRENLTSPGDIRIAPEDIDISKTSISKRFSRAGINPDYMKIVAIALICLGVVAAIIGILMPKPVEIEISNTLWEYDINIEKLTPVDESGWELPPGARLRYTRLETHHYIDVEDGYEIVTDKIVDHYDDIIIGQKDLENGYFEDITDTRPVYTIVSDTKVKYKKEPVEQTKYYYTVDKWLHSRYVSTAGYDKDPYWGEVILDNKERENGRSQVYYIIGMNDKNKQKKYTVDYGLWQECCPGMRIKGKVSVTGHFTLDEDDN